MRAGESTTEASSQEAFGALKWEAMKSSPRVSKNSKDWTEHDSSACPVSKYV